jgi:dienelactone hydrolase
MKSKTFIERIIFNPITQTFVIVISGGWIVIEITEYFIENFGLNEKARNIALVVFIAVLPLAICFAWYLNRKKKQSDEITREEPVKEIQKKPGKRSQSLIYTYTRPQILIPGILILLAIGISIFFQRRHQSRVLWAKGTAIPDISRLIENRNFLEAYHLAERAEKYIPDDSVLIRLWPDLSWHITIHSEPQGAEVYYKPYTLINEKWEYLGETPLDSIRFPYGIYRLKLDKEGYLTQYAGIYSDDILLYLDPEGKDSHGMVYIPKGTDYPGVLGIENAQAIVELDSYLIDKYEVTNKDYKEFVDAGGYTKKEYWKHAFTRAGKTLTWEEAMAEFVDTTGRSGPSTWEVGDYPDGKDDYPVTGVSWYEAAAYAEFSGKSLPTLSHWNFAANKVWSAEIVPFSNFDGEGPSLVGSYYGMGPYGTFDMAGNVREWCWNESKDQRLVLGGGWNDDTYMFNFLNAQSPFDRSETNGFRCMRYLGQPDNLEELKEPVVLPVRDFLNEPKVSDEVFAMFLSQYSYDSTNLNTIVEYVKEEEEYVKEKISFDAAYGNERMFAYLYLPKVGSPPYQIVIYFPGGTSIVSNSSENYGIRTMNSILLKSGRAIICPVYKSTYERGDELPLCVPNRTNFYKEHVIMWVNDVSRSIDYLETRDDIDTEKLAYYGVSWGGSMGAIVPAVEKRIKVSALIWAGLWLQRVLPEVDPVHYLPRIHSPVLMLSGRYDYIFPHEYSQIPFFTLLGTPKEDKKIQLFEYAKEMLAWLDKYLGPINVSAQ